jgi:hypothetical protein
MTVYCRRREDTICSLWSSKAQTSREVDVAMCHLNAGSTLFEAARRDAPKREVVPQLGAAQLSGKTFGLLLWH